MQATNSEWDIFKRNNISNMQVIAHYFHNKILKANSINYPKISLTPRQLEVLRWAANGKSIKDTGDIMSLSHHTVQTYLETARARLQALNTVHAVGRAIQLGLIDLPE